MTIPRPRARPSLGTLLDRERDSLDRLIAEAHAGARSADHYDDMDERADAMCRRIRAAYRSCRAATRRESPCR